MSYTKTLTFRANDLGTDATLVLIFNKPSDGLYHDKFPIVWKVSTFAPRGPYQTTATFSSQLSWLQPATDMRAIVSPLAYTRIDYNEQTTLQQDGSGALSFTTPETGTPGCVAVVNGTSKRQDVALGFLPQGDFAPVPVYFWNGLGASEIIRTNFRPVLRAYITSQYTESQIARGEIFSPILFEQDLSALDDNTIWDLRSDLSTGMFSITRA